MPLAFVYSLLAHILVGILLFVSVPDWKQDLRQNEIMPLWVDLRKVEVSSQTQLPAKPISKVSKKIEKQEKKESVSKNIPKVEPVKKDPQPKVLPEQPSVLQQSNPIKETPVVQKEIKQKESVPIVDKVEKKEVLEKKASVKVPKKSPEKIKEIKELKKPKLTQITKTKPQIQKDIKQEKSAIKETKPTKEKKSVKETSPEMDLDSILTSAERLTPSIPAQNEKTLEEISDSLIENEIGVSSVGFMGRPTIAQIEAIKACVNANWHIDSGMKAIENMQVAIRFTLGRDGDVIGVDFLDKNRIESDLRFRSLAESAKRAVDICNKMGDNSPFRIMAIQKQDGYAQWKSLRINFTPE